MKVKDLIDITGLCVRVTIIDDITCEEIKFSEYDMAEDFEQYYDREITLVDVEEGRLVLYLE